MLLTTATYAQEFHLGAKAGANLGKVEGVAYDKNFKLGYQLGGFVEFDFNDSWGLQGEVLFSQTNTELRDSYQSVWNDKFEKKKNTELRKCTSTLEIQP